MTVPICYVTRVKEDLAQTIRMLDHQIDIYTKARKNFLNDLEELNK